MFVDEEGKERGSGTIGASGIKKNDEVIHLSVCGQADSETASARVDTSVGCVKERSKTCSRQIPILSEPVNYQPAR